MTCVLCTSSLQIFPAFKLTMEIIKPDGTEEKAESFTRYAFTMGTK